MIALSENFWKRGKSMSKKSLAILFGGCSSEHDISCISVVTVAKAVNLDKYDMTLIGITRDGHWLLVDSISDIEDGSWRNSNAKAVISPDTDRKLIINRDGVFSSRSIDVAFPVMHGLFGEDGTIQGVFEMAHIPYVGCGTLSSAVTMDKFFTKVIVDQLDVNQAAYVPVRSYELADMDAVVARVEAARSYPVFIKPSNAGSSKGVSKAENRDELVKGLLLAAEHDTKILVEETIVGREIECAVFGHDENIIATGVGEILAAAEFYDFDAKYNNAESRTVISPELPEGKLEEIRQDAIQIFRAVDGFGLSRVDFFLEKGTNRVVFNEINTIPGHTAISMYPMLMQAAGYEMSDYIDQLIEMAWERHNYEL
jgi:D-alanine-D-alanine ligase